MAKQIALFPLDLVLFPGEEIELHIFEERYKKLFSEILEGKCEAGIIRKPNEHVSNVMGTLFSVVRIINTYKSGELDVLIRGEAVFTLNSFEEGSEDTIYPVGAIEIFDTDVFDKVPPGLLTLANEALRAVSGNANRPWTSLILTSELLQVLQLPIEVRERFLQSIRNKQWKSFLKGQLQLFISVQQQMRQLKGNYQLN